MACFTPENNAYCLPNVNAFLDTVLFHLFIFLRLFPFFCESLTIHSRKDTWQKEENLDEFVICYLYKK